MIIRRLTSLLLGFLCGVLPAAAQSTAPSISGSFPNAGLQGRTVNAVIRGANLDNASAISFSGTGVTGSISTGGTSTSLPVTVTIADNAAVGPRTITVTTPNGTSSPFSSFTVTNIPVPSINSQLIRPTGLSQSIAPWNGGPFPLTLTGTDFSPDSQVVFNGTALPTVYGSDTRLTTVVPANLLTTTGAFDVGVGKTGNLSGSLHVDIIVNSTVPVQAYQVTLRFDPSVLAVYPDSVTGGNGQWTDKPNTINTATPGVLVLNKFLTAITQSGTFNIAGVNFTPIAPGTSAITLSIDPLETSLQDISGNSITQGASLSLSTTSLTASPVSIISNTSPIRVVERGDINQNRLVNIGDALVLALNVGGAIKDAPLPNSVADLNMNGTVNIGDALVLALFAGRVNANMAAPVISSISPTPVARGGVLTIVLSTTGTAASDLQVVFPTANSVDRVTPTLASGPTTSTTLTVTVPDDAVSGPLYVFRVDAPQGSSSAPVIVGSDSPLLLSSVTPFFQQTAGTSITLTGNGFSSTPSSNNVQFRSLNTSGATSGTVTAASATQLTVTIPSDAVCGGVTVTTGGRTSNAKPIVVSGSTCPLLLTGILGAGSPGQVALLEGLGFNVGSPQANIVRFQKAGSGTVVAPVMQAGGTQLHVRIPDNAVDGDVTVTTTSTSNTLQYHPPATGPAQIVQVGTSPTSSTVASTIPLTVQVNDAANNGVSGVTVSFARTAGSGSVSATSAITGADGRASVNLTLGTLIGTNTFEASVSTIANRVTVSINGTPGPVSQLVTISGQDQNNLEAGTILPNPLVAEARDAYGNVLSGVSVTFAPPAGGLVSPATSQITGANGRVQVNATLGSSAGTQTFTASASNATPAVFSLTVIITASQLVSVSGNAQQDAPNSPLSLPLKVKVTNSYGFGVPGVSVAWAATAGGGSVSSSSVVTNATGEAQVVATLGSAIGTNQFTATVSGLAGSPITFTATSVLEAAPRFVDLQMSTGTTPLGAYQVTIQYDKNVVQFSAANITGGNGSGFTGTPLTINIDNAGGLVTLNHFQTSFSPAGDFTVAHLVFTPIGRGTSPLTLSNVSLTDTTGNNINSSFLSLSGTSVTVGSGSAATVQLVAISGNNQTAEAGTALPSVLVVEARQNGTPLQGAAVTFSVQNGGGSVNPSTPQTTGATGRVQVNATLGPSPGAQQFLATASGASPLLFNATATVTPYKIELVSGNNQAGTVGSGLALPLKVKVSNIAGIPVAGVAINWAATSGGGSLSASSATTNSSGEAQINVTNLINAGTNTFAASSTGLQGSPVAFTANVQLRTGTAIVVVGNPASSATVASSQTLTFQVNDNNAQPVPGVAVAFAVTSGSGSVSISSAISGSDGRVSVNALLGAIIGTNRFEASINNGQQKATVTITGVNGAVSQLLIVSGNNQSAAAGSALSSPLVVEARDQYGNVVPAATVTFSVVTGGGSVNPSTAQLTSANGRAQANATLGSVPGAQQFAATISGISPVVFTEVATSSPIAYYNFDTQGNPGFDSSSSALNGSATNVTQVAGLRGLAASMTNGYIQLPTSSVLNLLSGDFTLSVFIKSTDTTNTHWFTKASSSNHRYGLGNAGSQSQNAGLTFNGSAAGVANGTSNVFNGAWHHIAGIKRGTTAEIWVDGVRESTGTISPNFADDGAFALGRSGLCSSCSGFNGLMDEAKIWARALSASEIGVECGCSTQTQVGVITTIAGTGTVGFSGDGGAALSAGISQDSMVVDGAGNLYFTESLNGSRVRKITPGGVINTIAGTGTAGFSGDGGLATQAQLNVPTGIAVDQSGNLYISEEGNFRVRKITPAGIITTIAGNGTRGFSGDGGPATSAQLTRPEGIAVDISGNVFIVDRDNYRIRKITTAGIISTVAGGGSTDCDNCAATSAKLFGSYGLSIDAAGNLYIGDGDGHRIRKVTAAGIITTAAGTGVAGFSGDGGAATSAQLNVSSGAISDGLGNLYVNDYLNHRIRKVNSAGIISTFAGTGSSSSGGDGGPAASASFSSGLGGIDAAGNLYVSDTGRIRKIALTALGAPLITSLSPFNGIAGSSFAATLKGIAFTGATAVTFSGSGVTATIGNGGTDTSLPITLTVQAGAVDGIRTVTVTTPSGTSSGFVAFSVLPVPTITSITPASGAQGSAIPATISGTNLSNVSTVTFSGSGVTATIGTGATSTSLPITITIAANASTDQRTVTVTASGVSSAPFTGFTVTNAQPTVTSISQATSTRGTAFNATIGGSNLSGATAVTFLGTGVTATINSGVTATSIPISVTVGGNATPGPHALTVTTPSGTSQQFNGFTVLAPAISSIDTTSALQGQTVNATITGTRFTGVSAVTFSGAGVTATLGTATATSLPVTITVGANASADLRTFTVTTPEGTSDAFSGFTVLPAQNITGQIAVNGNAQYYVDVNPVSNKIFVSGGASGSQIVQMINGSNNTVAGTLGTGSGAHVNPQNNRVYAGGFYDAQLHVYDATTGASVSNLNATWCPVYVAVDTSNNRVYSGSQCFNVVDTFNGDTNSLIRTTSIGSVSQITVNPVTHRVYVTADGVVKRLDPDTGTVSPVSFTGNPVAVNAGMNLIYAQSGTTTQIIDGNTETALGSLPAAGAIAVNRTKNRIYLSDSSVQSVRIYDALTNTQIGIVSIPATSLGDIAVNSTTGTVYVFGYTGNAGTLYALNDSVALPAPTLTSINPTSGNRGQNVNVSMAGTNFIPGATIITVSGTGVTGANINVTSSTAMTATLNIAADAAIGVARTVTVSTAGGTSGTVAFTVFGPPATKLAITAAPAQIAAGSLSTLRVTGQDSSGITVTDATNTISVASNPATAVIIPSPTQLSQGIATLTFAATSAGTYTIAASSQGLIGASTTVTVVSGTAAALEIVSGNNQSGPGGGVLGTPLKVRVKDGFGNPTPNTTVTFTVVSGGGTVSVGTLTGSLVQVVTDSSGQAQVTATLGPAAGTLTYRASAAGVPSVDFTETATSSQTPTLSSVTPNSAPFGSAIQVTFSGTNFINGGTTITISGTGVTSSAITVVNVTTLTATLTIAPDAATGSRNVTLTTAAGTTGAVTFTVTIPPAPSLTGINPATAPQGTNLTVTLIGTNFIAGSTTVGVSGSGVSATAVTVISGTSLTASFTVSGNATSGNRNVSITTPGGTSNSLPFNVSVSTQTVNIIKTIAGTGTGGFTVDGQIATLSGLNNPNGVAADALGNVYIADYSDARIRKVDTNGVMTTVAGNGGGGFSGDGGAATAAQLSNPINVAFDSSGNLYIADMSNHRIRKVTAAGTISTVAGNGTGGFGGDGGQATAAQLYNPAGIAFDGLGNMYIADQSNQRIRKVGSNGVISTVAGNGTAGYSGDTGNATAAQLYTPRAVAVDVNGVLYIADYNNYRVRKVSNGIISTAAGQGSCGNTGDGGPATSACIGAPTGVALDGSNNLYIADSNSRVRKVGQDGVINAFAGTGNAAYSGDNGLAIAARINGPQGIATDSFGNVYIADTSNQRTRIVTPVTDGSSAARQVAIISGNNQTGGIGVTLTVPFVVEVRDQAGNPVSGASVSYSSAAGTVYPSTAQITGSNGRVSVIATLGNAAGTQTFIADIGVASATFSAIATNPVSAALNVIKTIAGNGGQGFSVDGQLATLSVLSNPNGVAVDSSGNVYIADYSNARIRKVDTNGVMTTVAGNGNGGFSGDGGAATAAQLSNPVRVLVDGSGNLYIVDYSNQRIRKVSVVGIISTIAGNGTGGYNGDGGAATSAQLYNPIGLARDASGNLYIADYSNHRIRKVTPGGIISTVAGFGTAGFSGDGGSPLLAQLYNPRDVAVDSTGSTIYIADYSNNRVRKVSNGIITTIAGGPNCNTPGDGGPATSACIGSPVGLALDSAGNLFISDGNGRIRKVTPDGLISTYAGNGTAGYSGDNGLATVAKINSPQGIALDASNNLYTSEPPNQRIRVVTPVTDNSATATQIVVISGNNQSAGIGVTLPNPFVVEVRNSSGNPVSGVSVSFGSVAGTVYPSTPQITGSNGRVSVIATLGNAAGNQLFVADIGVASAVFTATATNPVTTPSTLNVIKTIAGNGGQGFSVDGQIATLSVLSNPNGVAVDSSGNVYIADYSNSRIRKVDTSGVMTTVAGNGNGGFSGDGGAATAAQLSGPTRVLVDASNNLYIVDYSNQRIRKVSVVGIISTIAGNGTGGYNGDGGAATSAQLYNPIGLARDASGNLYIADYSNHRIRKVTPGGIISTVAGFGTAGLSGDGGSPLLAQLYNPRDVAVDSTGSTIYIADYSNNRVRKVSNGIITTIAGGPNCNTPGDGGPATSACIGSPVGLALDSSGNLFISDGNGRIRKVTPDGLISTVAGNGTAGYSGDNGLATVAKINSPQGIGLDASNNLYISEPPNQRIREVTSVTDNSATATQIVVISGNNQTAGIGVTLPSPFVVEVRNQSGNPVSGVSVSFGSVAGTVYPSTPQITGSNGRVSVIATLGNAAGNQLFVADIGVASAVFTATATNPVTTPSTLNVIKTIAGSGNNGFTVDGQVATLSWLSNPNGVAVDSTGNVYIADYSNSRIRKVDTNGVMTTVAGNGSGGFSGDGGAATAAQLSGPVRVLVDGSGNLYIVDYSNQRIRKVSVVGIISTIAGNGTGGYNGDGGAATSAQLYNPIGLARDAAGNLYIADYSNHRIRKVTPGGIISTVAGFGTAGFSGDGGSPLLAQLYNPRDVAVDSTGSTIYIADYSNNRVRKVSNGIITTIAGGPNCNTPGDGGPATSACIGSPVGLALDSSGNLFISDGNGRIRKVTPDGLISTYAGNGTAGYSGDNGLATVAKINSPQGIALDASNNLYISEPPNQRVRVVTSVTDNSATATQIVVLSGNNQTAGIGVTLPSPFVVEVRNSSGNPVSGVSVSFGSASGSLYPPTPQITGANGRVSVIATLGSSAGTQLFVADIGGTSVTFAALATSAPTTSGTISTVAGNGTGNFSGDSGQATAATLYYPTDAAIDASGNMYIADYYNHRIRKVGTDGVITTIAGTGNAGYSGDGAAATAAQLYYPQSVVVDSSGNLYIADYSNQRIRKVSSSGTITTYAGNGTAGYGGDGGAATSAQLYNPIALALDSSGNLYIADYSNHRIRKVTPGGTISTVVGTGTAGFSGDGGSPLLAQLYNPRDIAVDSNGNLYIADNSNNRVRKVSNGIISTVGGNGSGYSGDGGAATSAGIGAPGGVALDGSGNIYVSDNSARVRKITPPGLIITVAGNGTAGYGGDNGSATAAKINNPVGIGVDASGNLYIADYNNHRIRKVTAP